MFASLEAAQSKGLKVVVKADTQGSVEAIVEALKKIESEKISLEIIHSDVGTITENDVALASASKAVILGFHTRLDSTAAEKAKHAGVQIKLYAIIYELIDQVKDSMAGLLEPDSRKRSSARRKSGRFSNCPRACRSPAAWFPAAASSRARCACAAART